MEPDVTAEPRRGRPFVTALRRVGAGLLIVVGAYLVVRAALQPFVVDTSDPARYAGAWGGPSLLGVMAAHMLPGVLALALAVVWALRRRRRRSTGTT